MRGYNKVRLLANSNVLYGPDWNDRCGVRRKEKRNALGLIRQIAGFDYTTEYRVVKNRFG